MMAIAVPTIPFEDWAETNGINAPKLAVTGAADLRGVVVLEDVQAGEELCCVPRTSCLDLSAVEGSGSPCEALVPSSLWVSLRWYQRLACWLLAEQRRGAASPVSGYIGYLPRPETFANAPLEWTDDELAQLSYPPVAASIREQAAEISQLHASLIRSGAPLAPTVSEAELRWALQLVLSRAFTSTIATPKEIASRSPPPQPTPSSAASAAAKSWLGQVPLVGQLISGPPPPPAAPTLGDGLDMAMMPMLDAFNHRSDSQNSCAYDGERNSFVLTALKPLKPGEQAYLSYGAKSNDELLQLFGFVEQRNPHDNFLSIGFDDFLLAPTSGLFASPEAARSCYERLCSAGLDGALLAELTAAGAPPETMHALRVLFGTREEVEGDLRRLARPQSLETETRVWAAIRAYCKVAREALGGPRKKDEDGAARATREGRPRTALALTFRAEKKRLLSELENRLSLQAARSRKAGKVVS
jgi:hypothetical protein